MKVLGLKTPADLRDTLVKLYEDRLERMETSKKVVDIVKADLLKFLLDELKLMEFE